MGGEMAKKTMGLIVDIFVMSVECLGVHIF